jgi:phosphoserine phosphatase RsbU/P
LKFLNFFKENTLRLIFTIIALYCLIIASLGFLHNNIFYSQTTDDCLWRESLNGLKPEKGIYITDIVKGGVADDAGLHESDILLAINGKEVNSNTQAGAILNQYNSSDDVVYTIYRNGEILLVPINVYKVTNILNIIFVLLGVSFLVVGFLVGYSKPKEITSQIFFFIGCAAAMGFSFLPNISLFSSGQIFLLINNQLGLIMFFPLFIHFFLTYPIKFESPKRKLIIGFLYIYITILAILTVAFPAVLNFFFVYALNLSLLVYFIFGVTFFLLSYRKLIKQNEEQLKKPLNIIFKGFLIGGLGFAYLFLSPYFIPRTWLINNTLIFLPSAFVLAIPISFGYSIFRYKILDTELIVKRGIVFGIITGFVILLYLLLVFIIDSLLSQYLDENKQLITISLIVIVTFTFDFVNKRVKEFVEKQFYRERYNYRKSLLQFSEELPYLNNIDDIINKIGSAVKDTIRVKNLNIWIKDHTNSKLNGHANLYDKAFTHLFREDYEPKYLNDISLINANTPDNFIDLFQSNKIILSIPIVLKGDLKGSINFGEKQSDKSYSDEDIDLLQSLASQCAIALENSRLQLEEIHKQQFEEELEIAYKIQKDLLPDKDYSITGMDISGSSKPAKTIGGDFYDLIKLSDDKIIVIVADVSGKGIPAALYMSKIQAMIKFASHHYNSPKDILLEVNKQILSSLEKKNFVTIIMALFDMSSKKVAISRAGHNPLLIYSNGKINELESKGIGIGVGTHEQFIQSLEEITMNFGPGDAFVFYSDGLSEAMDNAKEMFGVDRISDLISKNIDHAAEDMKNDILYSVEKFRNEAAQFDDETIVVVKIK